MYVGALPMAWRRALSVLAGLGPLELVYWRAECKRLPRTYKKIAPANDNGG